MVNSPPTRDGSVLLAPVSSNQKLKVGRAWEHTDYLVLLIMSRYKFWEVGCVGEVDRAQYDAVANKATSHSGST